MRTERRRFWLSCRWHLMLGLVGLMMASQASAQPWPNFSATFDVKVMGFTIGEAHQSFYCVEQDCHLTSKAIPPDWAKAFINEETVEKIHLTYDAQTLTWQSYRQNLTRFYDNRILKRTTRMMRQDNPPRILSPDKDKVFPAKPYAFDQISLAYALAFYARQTDQTDRTLPPFVLQRDQKQTPIQMHKAFERKTIDLPFADNVSTLYFALLSDKIRIDLWLMPALDHFPVKVRLNDAEKDRTIELLLNKSPKL
ncbi:MAG: DUF3108 domain-containing protein [Hydrogenovibrio sp.]|nr:DUF3108 domain-containing protein [Hydrogenovibrio sp.]